MEATYLATVQVGLDRAKTESAIAAKTANELFEKARAERDLSEIQKTNMEKVLQECLRPWKQNGATIEFDAERKQWTATYQGVVAYGDTPDMACDNFDHLWMFGEAE